LTLTAALNQVTSYAYDQRGRRVAENNTGTTTYGCDILGNFGAVSKGGARRLTACKVWAVKV